MATHVLEMVGVSRRFADVVALDDLSFVVPAGSIVGFVGRNGAGKTTAMRIICGLLEADRGSVLWDGQPLDRAVRAQIGYIPEERGLYPKMRVLEQLEYLAVLHGLSHRAGRAAAIDWLHRLGLADRATAHVEELSLGNQQRIQLAAALVPRPELLVLDEPFSGLDPIVTDLLADILREQAAGGIPVLFSSHQLELVEHLCESVAIIDRGRLVACGPVAELRAAGPRLVHVAVTDAPPDWIAGVSDVSIVEHRPGELVLELAPAADSQQLLDAARRAGTVTLFAEERPTLAQLFRELVAA